jgi:hypothetical protein
MRVYSFCIPLTYKEMQREWLGYRIDRVIAVRLLVEAVFSSSQSPRQGLGPNRPPCPKGARKFSSWKSRRAMNLTTQLHPLQRLRKRGAIPPFPNVLAIKNRKNCLHCVFLRPFMYQLIFFRCYARKCTYHLKDKDIAQLTVLTWHVSETGIKNIVEYRFQIPGRPPICVKMKVF